MLQNTYCLFPDFLSHQSSKILLHTFRDTVRSKLSLLTPPGMLFDDILHLSIHGFILLFQIFHEDLGQFKKLGLFAVGSHQFLHLLRGQAAVVLVFVVARLAG